MQRVASLLTIKSRTDAGLGVLIFNRGQHRARDDIYFKLCHFTSLGAAIPRWVWAHIWTLLDVVQARDELQHVSLGPRKPAQRHTEVSQYNTEETFLPPH